MTPSIIFLAIAALVVVAGVAYAVMASIRDGYGARGPILTHMRPGQRQ